jgi:hypothetical protein
VIKVDPIPLPKGCKSSWIGGALISIIGLIMVSAIAQIWKNSIRISVLEVQMATIQTTLARVDANVQILVRSAHYPDGSRP